MFFLTPTIVTLTSDYLLVFDAKNITVFVQKLCGGDLTLLENSVYLKCWETEWPNWNQGQRRKTFTFQNRSKVIAGWSLNCDLKPGTTMPCGRIVVYRRTKVYTRCLLWKDSVCSLCCFLVSQGAWGVLCVQHVVHTLRPWFFSYKNLGVYIGNTC